ncbi:zinc ABC transporter permease AztB [Agrococcus jenensis]|uniref:Zinc/manganese transport system permease protein/manganese/iron transport system permease protein n=1 Tax=Agrococcus jenensis TaxID=46353 RepID=A0A3N2ARE4_9MICO|nr:zinc ABC transporter permease AztB [Agrococcus jenensis]ROR65556.1 zinc/manganese transport system permease protein/manganese/iron transport system permease protein [Agrococcus jenensis]
MPWSFELLLAPFETSFFARALLGGALAACICAVAGAWVVARGMAFLGEALGHGMLPGVAIATIVGGSPLVGAAASAAAMAVGIGWLTRRARLRDDTAIGIAFVGMLALGVVIVSHSGSFATDATAILFGDVLAIREAELLALAIGLGATAALAALLHRPILALAFDERIATTLRLRPGIARVGLAALITIAVVASYQAVGTLLVVALLVAPPAAAAVWSRSIVGGMLGGAAIGSAAVAAGLIGSWHLGTAAGASIAIAAVLAFAASSALRALVDLRPRDGARFAAPTPTDGAPARASERSAA